MRKEVNKVYQTTDYGIFKKLLGNRAVERKREKKIEESINRVGQLQIPIIVNKNMEIIDGQARVSVFEKMGLPVWYVVIPNGGKKECIALNAYQSSWTSEEYVKSYCEEGNENFIRLSTIVNEFHIPLGTAVGIAKGKILTGGGNWSWEIKDGTLEITQEEYENAFNKLDWLMPFMDVVKQIPGNTRGTTTMLCWAAGVADANRIRSIVTKNYPIIYPVVDVLKSLTQLSQLYNKNIREKVYFDAIYRDEQYGV